MDKDNDMNMSRSCYGIVVTPGCVKAVNHYGRGINTYLQNHPEYTVICRDDSELRKSFQQKAESCGLTEFWAKADEYDRILVAGTPDEEGFLGPFESVLEASISAGMAQSRAQSEYN